MRMYDDACTTRLLLQYTITHMHIFHTHTHTHSHSVGQLTGSATHTLTHQHDVHTHFLQAERRRDTLLQCFRLIFRELIPAQLRRTDTTTTTTNDNLGASALRMMTTTTNDCVEDVDDWEPRHTRSHAHTQTQIRDS